MLAKEYSKNMKMPKKLVGSEPPIGWLMSEKLDGYRARFNPKTKQFNSSNDSSFERNSW